jgi:23S rRNA (adenine-N6)-dimethyltransferase
VRSARVPQGRPGGRHLLRSSALAAAIVRDAGVRAGELVVDVGAGSGMLTRPLLGTGARVLAIEPDRVFSARLRRACPDAHVVEADALTLTWPREPFRVVANLPFAHAAEICRALFHPAVPLEAADLIVEWDFAAKRARVWPSTAQTVIWSAWHELTVTRRLAPEAFAPRPSVAAALLRVRRRANPLVEPGDAAGYDRFVRDAFRRSPKARELDAFAWAARFKESSASVRTVSRMPRSRRAR